jgi:hypothetical protein
VRHLVRIHTDGGDTFKAVVPFDHWYRVHVGWFRTGRRVRARTKVRGWRDVGAAYVGRGLVVVIRERDARRVMRSVHVAVRRGFVGGRDEARVRGRVGRRTGLVWDGRIRWRVLRGTRSRGASATDDVRGLVRRSGRCSWSTRSSPRGAAERARRPECGWFGVAGAGGCVVSRGWRPTGHSTRGAVGRVGWCPRSGEVRPRTSYACRSRRAEGVILRGARFASSRRWLR